MRFAEKTLHICPIYVDYPKAVPNADFVGISVLEDSKGGSSTKVSLRLGCVSAWSTATRGLGPVRKAFCGTHLMRLLDGRVAE